MARTESPALERARRQSPALGGWEASVNAIVEAAVEAVNNKPWTPDQLRATATHHARIRIQELEVERDCLAKELADVRAGAEERERQYLAACREATEKTAEVERLKKENKTLVDDQRWGVWVVGPPFPEGMWSTQGGRQIMTKDEAVAFVGKQWRYEARPLLPR
jgi:hypothetical protein